VIRKLLMLLVRLYQRAVSPLLPPACRFQPTCSHYAYEAVEAHGALRGVAMAIWRLARCNPLNDGGYEPLPTPKRRGVEQSHS